MLYIYSEEGKCLQFNHLSFMKVLNSSEVCSVLGSVGVVNDTFVTEMRKSRSVEPNAAEKKRSSPVLVSVIYIYIYIY